jgi:hypothetical protein
MQNSKKAIKRKDIDWLGWIDRSQNQEFETIFGNFSVDFWQFLPVLLIVSNAIITKKSLLALLKNKGAELELKHYFLIFKPINRS